MNRSHVITRFAPSPTGVLHIGGARTALFNWLLARAKGGKFLLRIEDTDQTRSTPEASAAIIVGLTWLGIDWDGDVIYQRNRQHRHRAMAEKLLADGAAYKCFCSPKEVEELRQAARKRQSRFVSPWRDAAAATHPDKPYCLRLKAPVDGTTVIDDNVYGHIQWDNQTFDDLVILRTSGSPTYNFAVVVDDHDMGVTHVIRGDDHLTNTAKQLHVYKSLGWNIPEFSHVPLILDEEGKKLSKRTSSLGVDHYRMIGIPAVAMLNYLARLGWSHGDDEFFTTEQAVAWFDLGGLRKSAARLDMKKLTNLSKQHLAAMDDNTELLNELNRFRQFHGEAEIGAPIRDQTLAAIAVLKVRSKTFADLNSSLAFVEAKRPLTYAAKALALLDDSGKAHLCSLMPLLKKIDWSRTLIDESIQAICAQYSVGFGRVAQPIRSALTGQTSSPSVIDIMLILGQDETIGRIDDALGNKTPVEKSMI